MLEHRHSLGWQNWRSGWLAASAALMLGLSFTAAPAQQAQVYVSNLSVPEHFTGSLSDLPTEAVIANGIGALPEIEVELLTDGLGTDDSGGPAPLGPEDPAAQLEGIGNGLTATLEPTPPQFSNANPNFDGINQGQVGFNPPDTQGDVGPDHYIQVVNAAFQIWDKDGNPLTPVININTLWAGTSNLQAPCRDNNAGDPIVLYDHLADRWVISQFVRPRPPDFQCIAVSMGPDPVNDGWFLYTFQVLDETGTNFPHDYPKIGVWPDGYYMGSQQGFSGGDLLLVVYDRANMINGNPASFQSLRFPGNPAIFWLPADLDGPPPPAGTNAYFARMVDPDYFGQAGNHRIEIIHWNTDWQDPSNTGIALLQPVQVLDFDQRLCGGGDPGLFQYCIPQPNVVSLLEGLTVWPMWRLQYRNFGDRDTMVFNHTVNADGNGTAGIRWYELERGTPGSGNWTLRQQGTYAPQDPENSQPEHRWMGSIAMDRFGHLALGYSVSSTNLVASGDAVDGFPSIRYTGRQTDAPLGLLPEAEATLQQGTGSRNEDLGDQQVRWGDYSAMVVDPVDDCSFWYTTEYIASGSNNWRTRIGAFSFADCHADISIAKADSPDPVLAGEQLVYTITVTNEGILDATDVIVTDELPAGVSFVSDDLPSPECFDTAGPTITCNLGALAAGDSTSLDLTVLVNSDILFAPDEPISIENTASVDADQNDPDGTNNSVTELTLVNELADLIVTKVCKPDGPANAGDQATCDIILDNAGPSGARNVTLVDELVSDGTFTTVSAAASQGSCVIDANEDVDCSLLDIDAGERVTIVVTVESDDGVDVNDKATATSDTPDPNTANNSDQGSVSFLALADLGIEKTGSVIDGAKPTTIEYVLTVENHGPSAAQNVVVTDNLPTTGKNNEPVGVVSVSSDCIAVDLVVTCTTDTIAEGAIEQHQIVILVKGKSHVLQNVASVSSETSDPTLANNEDEHILSLKPGS